MTIVTSSVPAVPTRIVNRPAVIGTVRRETPDWNLDLGREIWEGGGVALAVRRGALPSRGAPIAVKPDHAASSLDWELLESSGRSL